MMICSVLTLFLILRFQARIKNIFEPEFTYVSLNLKPFDNFMSLEAEFNVPEYPEKVSPEGDGLTFVWPGLQQEIYVDSEVLQPVIRYDGKESKKWLMSGLHYYPPPKEPIHSPPIEVFPGDVLTGWILYKGEGIYEVGIRKTQVPNIKTVLVVENVISPFKSAVLAVELHGSSRNECSVYPRSDVVFENVVLRDIFGNKTIPLLSVTQNYPCASITINKNDLRTDSVEFHFFQNLCNNIYSNGVGCDEKCCDVKLPIPETYEALRLFGYHLSGSSVCCEKVGKTCKPYHLEYEECGIDGTCMLCL